MDYRPAARLFSRLRANWLTSLILDGIMMIAIFVAVSAWQGRDLLSSGGDQLAPDIALIALDGQTYSLSDERGRKVLVYFFAPWCSVCNLAAHNLEDVYQNRGEEAAVYLVAIGYSSVAAVEEYRSRHNLTMPILLDDGSAARDYRISATPTYYIIDEAGQISSTSVGYSTEVGMRLRML